MIVYYVIVYHVLFTATAQELAAPGPQGGSEKRDPTTKTRLKYKKHNKYIRIIPQKTLFKKEDKHKNNNIM